MIDAHGSYHISTTSGGFKRSIGVPTVVDINDVNKEIKATDFDIGIDES